MQIALEQHEQWRDHATITLDASEKLLNQIQAYLPAMMDDKLTFFQKLEVSFNAEKTSNLTTRLTNINTLLRQLCDCPPLWDASCPAFFLPFFPNSKNSWVSFYSCSQTKLSPENGDIYARWLQGRIVTACVDWTSTNRQEFSIEEGDQFVLKGIVTERWVKVRYHEEDHNIPARQQDIIWKWVPQRCLLLC